MSNYSGATEIDITSVKSVIKSVAELLAYDQEFLDGTSPRIYPWAQSKIQNLKSKIE